MNACATGATATAMFTRKVQARTAANTALGRLGTPEDIARVVAWPLSDEAGWITGQVIDADGGLRRLPQTNEFSPRRPVRISGGDRLGVP